MLVELPVLYPVAITSEAVANNLRDNPNAARYQLGSALVFVKGVSSAGVADGNQIEHKGLLKVTGTKSYTDTLGAQRTVFVVEPVAQARKQP